MRPLETDSDWLVDAPADLSELVAEAIVTGREQAWRCLCDADDVPWLECVLWAIEEQGLQVVLRGPPRLLLQLDLMPNHLGAEIVPTAGARDGYVTLEIRRSRLQ